MEKVGNTFGSGASQSRKGVAHQNLGEKAPMNATFEPGSTNIKKEKVSVKDKLKQVSWKENWAQFKFEASTTYLAKLVLVTLVLRSFGPAIIKFLSGLFPNSDLFPPADDIDASQSQFNGMAFFDEFANDFICEAPWIYGVIPGSAPLLASFAANKLGLKDYRLAGIPMKDLEEKSIAEVGKYEDLKGRLKEFNKGKYKIDARALDTISRVKFFTGGIVCLTGALSMAMGPHLKNLLTIGAYNESNPYIIQGMHFDRTEDDIENQNAYIKKRSLGYILSSIGVWAASVLGVSALVFKKGQTGKPGLLSKEKFNKWAKIVDVGKNFQLSRMAFISIMSTALWSYLAGARPVYNDSDNATRNPEFSELFRRIWFVVFAAFFGKSILKGATVNAFVGRKFKVDGKKSINLRSPWEEMKKRNGFLSIETVHWDYIKTTKDFKKLSGQKQKELKKSLDWFEKWGMYIPLLAFGTAINTYNYAVTFKKDYEISKRSQFQAGSDSDLASSDDDRGLLEFAANPMNSLAFSSNLGKMY